MYKDEITWQSETETYIHHGDSTCIYANRLLAEVYLIDKKIKSCNIAIYLDITTSHDFYLNPLTVHI